MIYNCILRGFPQDLFAAFQNENMFPTTIHVLASAVQKIGRAMVLPHGLTLYRGLGGLMDLPENFFKSDSRGRKGYAEWSFMSTTSSKEVALNYSGIKRERPLASCLVINVSAIDRGACVRHFSQYPSEIEYLFLPLSFSAPSIDPFFEFTSDGLVRMIPIRVNLNLKSLTIEEMIGKKRQIHLSSFQYMLNELLLELDSKSQQDNVIAKCIKEGPVEDKKNDLQSFIQNIANEGQSLFKIQEQISGEEYCHNKDFEEITQIMFAFFRHAHSKFNYWYSKASITLEKMLIDDCEAVHYHKLLIKESEGEFLNLTTKSIVYDESYKSSELNIIFALSLELCGYKNFAHLQKFSKYFTCSGLDNLDLDLALYSAIQLQDSVVMDLVVDKMRGVLQATILPLYYNKFYVLNLLSIIADRGSVQHLDAILGGLQMNKSYEPEKLKGILDNSFLLHIAAKSGKPGAIQVLINYKAHPGMKASGSSPTPLWICDQQGSLHGFNELPTPLWICAQQGFLQGLDELLGGEYLEEEELSYLVNSAYLHNHSGCELSSASVAAFEGHRSCVQRLADCRANVSETLFDMVMFDRWQCIDTLIQCRADPNANCHGMEMTPLMFAISNNKFNCLREIIKTGIQLDTISRDMVLMALRSGYVDSINVLREFGADLSQDLSSDMVSTIESDLVHFILLRNVNTVRNYYLCFGKKTPKFSSGWSMVLFAAYYGHVDIVRLLSELGIDLSWSTPNGITAGMLAAQAGHTDVLLLLDRMGVNMKATMVDGWNALMSACYCGKLETVQALLRMGLDLHDTENVFGYSPLTLAALVGCADLLVLLHSEKADINQNMHDGTTAVMLAAQGGHSGCIKVLHQLGANVADQRKDGGTAIMLACQNGHTDALKLLHELGGDINTVMQDGETTAMICAVQNGHSDCVTWLKDLGCSISVDLGEGATLLMLAAQQGFTGTVGLLSALGIDVNARMTDGGTALMLAAQNGHSQTVEELCKLKAEINALCCDEISALTLAAERNQLETVEVLIQLGSKLPSMIEVQACIRISVLPERSQPFPNKIDHLGIQYLLFTLLLEAIKNGDLDMIDRWCKMGIDVNFSQARFRHISARVDPVATQNNESKHCILKNGQPCIVASKIGEPVKSALMCAIEHGHIEVIKLLHEYGADISSVGHNCFSPLMFAVTKGKLEYMRLLNWMKARVDEQLDDGHTALTLACMYGNADAVRLLVSFKASVDSACGTLNPLLVACEYGQVECIQTLYELTSNIDAAGAVMFGHNWVLQDCNTVILCCGSGNIEALKCLIDLKADVNTVCADGWTALTMSIAKNRSDCLDILFHGGADLNLVSNDWGYTALMLAAMWQNWDMIEVLMSLGADVTSKNKNGTTLVDILVEIQRSPEVSVAAVGRILKKLVAPQPSEFQNDVSKISCNNSIKKLDI